MTFTKTASHRRTFLQTAVAVALSAGLWGTASAQQEIKIGHVGEPGSIFQKSADEFARRANAKLGSKAKVVAYGSSQLGGDKEMIQKVKLGTLDMAVPSTVMSSEVDLFGIFEMPYLVKDRAHMQRIEKEIFWPSLAPAAEKKGVKVLAVWENGYRNITNNKRPIRVPADLDGIKFRVGGGVGREEFTVLHLVGLRLGDLPVLAVQAAEVAAGGGQREGFAAGRKMIERFLLDRVDVHGAGVAVGQAVERAVHVDLGAAHAAVSGGQHTVVGADQADNLLLVQTLEGVSLP